MQSPLSQIAFPYCGTPFPKRRDLVDYNRAQAVRFFSLTLGHRIQRIKAGRDVFGVPKVKNQG